jgi:ribonuclease BN (tRNA processing enzyme)
MTRILSVLLLVGAFGTSVSADTRVVVLGTGTPVPDAARAGAGIAVVVDGEAYLFDAGGGVAHRAAQAAERLEMPALTPQNVAHLFITHLHSDHLHDVSELATARWWSRKRRLRIWAPRGMAAYVEHMNAMATVEANVRVAGTPPELIADRQGYLAAVTEIEDGVVFRDDRITVEAFTVPHGDIRPSFGYKVTTADRSIVISGDTAISPAVAEKARGVDLLFHEVISGDRLAELSEFWQHYHGTSHTTTGQLAKLASQARPRRLVLYHVLFSGATADEVVAEVKRGYDGEVVLADDLDVF